MTGVPSSEPAKSDDSQLDGASLDVAGEKRRAVLDLFPEARAEVGSIDFEQLRRALGDVVDPGKERFGLTWPGKAACFKSIQTPSMATLLPLPEKSADFEATGNVIIEGDNLEVLKLLQKSYLGKVRMIYIDPPYNTGNDFIYPDDYGESLQTYLRYTGQIDDDGKRFSNNTDADGRFHSKWLNMMYPRLYLARNLLRDDGLLFVSIDQTESSNLVEMLNQIFGAENFVEQIVWKNKYGSGAGTSGFASVHEYVVCFSKRPLTALSAPLSEEAIAQYRGRDEKYDIRGGFITQPLATKSKDDRPNLRFGIEWNGTEIFPEKQWIWSRERVAQAMANNEVVITEKDGRHSVRVKQYLRDENGILRKGKPLSLLLGPFNQEGTSEVDGLFGERIFDFPKPIALLRHFFSMTVNESEEKDGIFLDFFAGSGTAAHALLDLNAADGGARRFILVQLPEPTGRTDYPTISDIAEERVRRAAKKLADAESERLVLGKGHQDRGFRVFMLAESNVREWDTSKSSNLDNLQEQLKLGVEHLRPDRTELDIVYEVLLKSGFTLSETVTTETVAGHTVYSVSDGVFLICLEHALTLDFIRAVADRKPERVLFLDRGFASNDQLKANAAQTFKNKNIVFRTL